MAATARGALRYYLRRPVPLATVELQKLASQRLRLPSDRTMELAEGLYTRGYLSYPRTETDKFKEGFDLQTLIQAQAAHPQWGGYATCSRALECLNV